MRVLLLAALASSVLLLPGPAAACGVSTSYAGMVAAYAHGRAVDAAALGPPLRTPRSPPFAGAVDALDALWHGAVFAGLDLGLDAADQAARDADSCL